MVERRGCRHSVETAIAVVVVGVEIVKVVVVVA